MDFDWICLNCGERIDKIWVMGDKCPHCFKQRTYLTERGKGNE